MFNIKTIAENEYLPGKVSVKGKAISVSDDFNYDDDGLVEYFKGIPEVAEAELISYKNYPGGGNEYSVVLTPEEGVTVEQLIEEVPQYKPQDKNGNYDVSEVGESGYKNLHIFDPGEKNRAGSKPSNRADMYSKGLV